MSARRNWRRFTVLMAGVVIVLTSLHVALAALGIGFLWRLVIVQPFSMLFCILALKAAE